MPKEEAHLECDEKKRAVPIIGDLADNTKSSRRVRRAPKKYTPNSTKNKVYCYCQREDSGWYLKCDFVYSGCLEYYHAKCVGLEKLTERGDADNYSNCKDGRSYACPTCFKIVERKKETSLDSENNASILQSSLEKGSVLKEESNEITSEGHEYEAKSHKDFDNRFLNDEIPLNYNLFDEIEENICLESCYADASNDDYAQHSLGSCKFIDEVICTPTQHSGLYEEDQTSEVNISPSPKVCWEESKEMPTSVDTVNVDSATLHLHEENLFSCEQNLIDESNFILSDEEFDFSQCDFVQNDEAKTENAQLHAQRSSLPVSEETLKTLMDCPKLTTNTFFMPDTPRDATFRLTDDEWKRIEPTHDKPDRFQPCWTSVMASHLSESNDYCTFRFKRHFIQRQNSRKRHCDIFKASGNCVFLDCTCSFKLVMTRTQFHMKEIAVNYDGQVKHATGERQSRFIQNDERKALASKFKESGCKPSKVYQELKENLSSDAKASGNRTGCGVQPTTVRKIASESRQNEYISKDMVESLLMIRKLFIEKESSRNKPPSKIEGFIHTISVHPLIVCMWTESQVRLWHDRVLHDVAYLDATGTIVGNHNGKRSLYYALAVHHPTVGNPPVPVAEMITNDHSAINIRGFLEKFKRDDGRVFNGKEVIPRQITTDYSKAIILAVLREFNNESLLLFFTRAYRLLRKEGTGEDFKLTIPHVGCSHFMHIVHKNLTAVKRLRQNTKGNAGNLWYHFNMYCMSLLVNASTLGEFDVVLKDATVCLKSKFLLDKVQASYDNIVKRVKTIGTNTVDDIVNNAGEFDDTIPTDASGESSVPVSTNPFSLHFRNLLNPIIDQIDVDNKRQSDQSVENRSWCPEFFEFMRSHIHEMPLWSGVLLGSLDRYKKMESHDAHKENNNSDEAFLSYKSANAKSEGYIEGVMRQLKQEDFSGKKRIRADAFALENYNRIRRRLTDFGDRLHSTIKSKPKRKYTKRKLAADSSNSPKAKRLKKDRGEDYHTAEETWGKKDPSTPKANPKLGQFQQSPSVAFSDSPAVKGKKEKTSANDSRSTSAFLLFLGKKRKGLKRKYRNDVKVLQEATKIWRSMSLDEKEKYHRMAKDKDITKVKSTDHAKDNPQSGGSHNNPKNYSSDMREWCRYRYKKLQNNGNDCWLNTMLQCINHLTIRDTIGKSLNKNISPLISALIRAMKKMKRHIAIPFYPQDLHNLFQMQFNYVPNTQNDIHESFTQLLAYDESYEDVMTCHFQYEMRYTKICQKCQKREDLTPEKLTTTFVPLCGSVTDVSDAVYKSFREDSVQLTCDTCQECTTHSRLATLLTLPDVLLLMFKRFANVSGQGRKLHSKVRLQKQITLVTDEPWQYDLRACALHHGASLYSGHYTSLVFEEENVVELDDTHINCVTDEWENRASSTVYLAFYCRKQNCAFEEEENISIHDQINPTNSIRNAESTSQETHNDNSVKSATKITKCTVEYATCESDVSSSLIMQTQKKLDTIWDISVKDVKICDVLEQGYDLFGVDFKTLQLSKGNNSYQREKPGWLNDNIIDAYLNLLTRSASANGKRIFAFPCSICLSLNEAISSRNVDKLYRMVSKHYRREIFESYDFLVFPINIGDLHWCVVVVDMWDQEICYYDPLITGSMNESAVKNITFFLKLMSTARKRLAKFESKQFVSDFTVCWEDKFPLQTDGESCGVFILMYVGTKLGITSTCRVKKRNEIVRILIAYELLQSRNICTERIETEQNSCKVMSLFSQDEGGKVILHCMVVGIKPKEFAWIFNDKIVFRIQTPTFKLTKAREGMYVCRIYYDNGTTLQSNPCKVLCTEDQIDLTSDAFHKIYHEWCDKES